MHYCPGAHERRIQIAQSSIQHYILEAITWTTRIRRIRLNQYNRSEEEQSEEILRCPFPNRREGEMFGVADQLLGASRIKIVCADGKSRMGRIPVKIRKRMWIREGDLVIVKPWEFQDDKADIMYRYTKTQASYLSRRKMLPKSLDVF